MKSDTDAIRAAAATMGRKGGKVRSQAKAEAARRNGHLGGRPLTDKHQHRARNVGPLPPRSEL